MDALTDSPNRDEQSMPGTHPGLGVRRLRVAQPGYIPQPVARPPLRPKSAAGGTPG